MNPEDVSRRSFLEKSLLATGAAGLVLSASQCTSKPAEIIPVQLGDGEKLKMAVFGCGNRSRSHIAAMNAHDRIEITALCDILPEMLEEKKALVEGSEPRLYTDYQEMLTKEEDLHGVSIVLPNALHRMGAEACFEAGKHVLNEKPLALNITDARAMIAAGDKAQKAFQVSTQGMHSPVSQVCGKEVHGGALGNLLYAWIQTFRGDWRKLFADQEEDSKKNWRMSRAKSGGITFEQGIHTLAFFNWLIGSEPVEIASIGGYHNSKLEKRDSLDHAGILVRYANNVLMTYGGNNYSCGGPGANCLFGDVGTLAISRRGATIRTRTYWNPYREPGSVPRGERPQDPNRSDRELEIPQLGRDVTADVLQYRHFFEAVQGQKVPFPSARDHLPALQIAVGSLMAMDERRTVRVDEVM